MKSPTEALITELGPWIALIQIWLIVLIYWAAHS
jgi:hypothetical protein